MLSKSCKFNVGQLVKVAVGNEAWTDLIGRVYKIESITEEPESLYFVKFDQRVIPHVEVDDDYDAFWGYQLQRVTDEEYAELLKS